MGIEYAKDGPVATFTIANGKVNPITPAMHREMAAAMADFLADPDLRVGILTGAGERAFSAGDDIKSEDVSSGVPAEDLLGALGSGPLDPTGTAPAGYDFADAVLRMDRTKPVIGAVRGWCLGRGLFYLLRLTDIRVCTPDARFGLPEIAYGMGGIGGTMQLTRYLPAGAAYELALTGEPIGADEAVRLGMVNRIVEPSALMDEARRVAGLVARHPPLAVRTEMEAMRRAEELDADDAYVLGMTLYRQQRLAIGESDVQDAFLYKR
jgi:enoyl-CoA hydratase/carnithine racemase